MTVLSSLVLLKISFFWQKIILALPHYIVLTQNYMKMKCFIGYTFLPHQFKLIFPHSLVSLSWECFRCCLTVVWAAWQQNTEKWWFKASCKKQTLCPWTGWSLHLETVCRTWEFRPVSIPAFSSFNRANFRRKRGGNSFFPFYLVVFPCNVWVFSFWVRRQQEPLAIIWWGTAPCIPSKVTPWAHFRWTFPWYSLCWMWCCSGNTFIHKKVITSLHRVIS